MSFLGPAGINASTALTLDAGMGCPEAREKQMVLLPDSQIVEKNVSERFRFVCYESRKCNTVPSASLDFLLTTSNQVRVNYVLRMASKANSSIC